MTADPIRLEFAEWVDVRRDAAMQDQLEVFGDLRAGDQVAVRGTDEWGPGPRVRIAPQAK